VYFFFANIVFERKPYEVSELFKRYLEMSS